MRDTISGPFFAMLIVAMAQAGLAVTMPASAGVPGGPTSPLASGRPLGVGAVLFVGTATVMIHDSVNNLAHALILE